VRGCMKREPAFDLSSLQQAYASGALTPEAVAEVVSARMEVQGGEGIWIDRLSADELRAAARDIERRFSSARPPLYGIPFAVKDNIDVAGRATTAACPALTYTASRSATVVDKLRAAGALLVGKTNMDQLATGLVGVRSPFGVAVNPFDDRYPVGGSSAGSAAAVARGQVSFALGTDTAGSGRVPAAFTNTVGLKPTRGVLSAAGVVPACRSLDCVSVFALSVEEAALVADLAGGYDPADPGSRPDAGRVRFGGAAAPARFRFGVIAAEEREHFGDDEAARLHQQGIETLCALGGEPVTLPFAPFREAGRLLYDGPWVAERLVPFEELVRRNAVLPVIARILESGYRVSGLDVFRAAHRLEELRQEVRGLLGRVDALFLPTTPTIYTIAEIEADPIRLNARLGLYTNFVNLLDLAGVAVPGPFRTDGLPAGFTFLGPRDSDARLAALAARFHRQVATTAGATELPLPAAPSPSASDGIRLAVVGAHLSGEPLNGQLTSIGARLVRTCRTAPLYRLYALPNVTPPKPGLVRVASDGGAIEIEIWEVPAAALGGFVAGISPPLCIGTLTTEDGEAVKGFLCEAHAADGARDITALGGWRRFVHG
jgi:allophanate hydrolase